MTDTTLRLRSTSHTQSYFFYIKYRHYLKNFKSISIMLVKLYYIQNKSKIDLLDFLSLTVQIDNSTLQNERLKTIKMSQKRINITRNTG